MMKTLLDRSSPDRAPGHETLLIEIVDLTKIYGLGDVAVRALRGVDVPVERGEFVAIMGRSGSGKSTILKLMLGLIRPESGHISIDEDEIGGMTEQELMSIRAKIGMVFQEGALFDSLTVGGNVGFRLREHEDLSDEEIEKRVRRMLGFVELEEFFDRMPSELSGGQRRRVAVARAMAHQPEMILYDEATTGLDPITATTINELIRSLQRRLGVTSIVVTHDIHSAFTVGDRIAFLHEGRIVFEDVVDEAKRATNPLLRAFLKGGGYG